MIESSLGNEPVANMAARPPARIVRALLAYTAMTALLFLPPMYVFVPAALLHCGLRHGRRIAWLVLLIAAPVAGVLLLQALPGTPADEVRMSYSIFAALVLGLAVPSLLVLPMVQRREPFGRVLVAALIASVAGLAVTELALHAWLGFSPYTETLAMAHESVKQMTMQNPALASGAAGKLAAEVTIYCVPAFVLIDLAVFYVLSLVMVGRLTAWRQFVETRAVPEPSPYLFRNLALPEWLLVAFVVAGLSPLAHGMLQKVGANVLAVVVFLYLVQGLAIFRALLAAIGAGFIGVLFAYGTLAVLAFTGLSPVLLTVAGLFDSFFDFRHFNRKDHSDESHSD